MSLAPQGSPQFSSSGNCCRFCVEGYLLRCAKTWPFPTMPLGLTHTCVCVQMHPNHWLLYCKWAKYVEYDCISVKPFSQKENKQTNKHQSKYPYSPVGSMRMPQSCLVPLKGKWRPEGLPHSSVWVAQLRPDPCKGSLRCAMPTAPQGWNASPSHPASLRGSGTTGGTPCCKASSLRGAGI